MNERSSWRPPLTSVTPFREYFRPTPVRIRDRFLTQGQYPPPPLQVVAIALLLCRLQDVRLARGIGEHGVGVLDGQGQGPRKLPDA